MDRGPRGPWSGWITLDLGLGVSEPDPLTATQIGAPALCQLLCGPGEQARPAAAVARSSRLALVRDFPVRALR